MDKHEDVQKNKLIARTMTDQYKKQQKHEKERTDQKYRQPNKIHESLQRYNDRQELKTKT